MIAPNYHFKLSPGEITYIREMIIFTYGTSSIGSYSILCDELTREEEEHSPAAGIRTQIRSSNASWRMSKLVQHSCGHHLTLKGNLDSLVVAENS